MLTFQEPCHLFYLRLLILQFFQTHIPKFSRSHRKNIALEFRHLCWSSHRIAKVPMNWHVSRTGVFVQGPTHSHYTDYKFHLRCVEILSDVPYEMSKAISVGIISTRLIPVRICSTRHHIIPPLKPGKSSKLISFLFVVLRINPFDISKHLLHMVHHQTIKPSRLFSFFSLYFFNVLSPAFEVIQFIFIEDIGTS